MFLKLLRILKKEVLLYQVNIQEYVDLNLYLDEMLEVEGLSAIRRLPERLPERLVFVYKA